MSTMKNFGNFDEKSTAGVILDAVTDEQFDKVNELCGDKFEEMYDEWVAVHGVNFAINWVEENGGYITGYDEFQEFAQHLIENFIGYLQQ